MADALKHNGTLETFQSDAFPSEAFGDVDEMDAAIEEALEHNVSLQSIESFLGSGWPVCDSILNIAWRNQVLRKQRHALAGLARCSDGVGWGVFTVQWLRDKVFPFLVPAGWKWAPSGIVPPGSSVGDA